LAPANFVGDYQVDEASSVRLPAGSERRDGSLSLKANGEFVLDGLPGLLRIPPEREMRFESGRGVWKVIRVDGEARLQLEFLALVDWEGGLPFGCQVCVAKRELFYFIGDPDEGRRVVLKKLAR